MWILNMKQRNTFLKSSVMVNMKKYAQIWIATIFFLTVIFTPFFKHEPYIKYIEKLPSKFQTFICQAKNLSKCNNLLDSIFPNYLKVSLVAPAFNNVGERSTAKNYSPLSFFLIGTHFTQDWTTTTRHGVTGKISTKRLKQFFTENLSRKNLQLIGVC